MHNVDSQGSRAKADGSSREANDEIKKQKKDGILTEDDQRSAEKAVQDLTDRYCKLVDEKVAKKEKEIMEL